MRPAHWIQKTHLLRAGEFVCSACGAKSDRPYRFCPACGAPMKKAGHEASWVDEAEGLSALLDDDW